MEFSFSNLAYVGEQYQRFLLSPESVEPSWRYFFEGWQLAKKTGQEARQETSCADLNVDHLIQAYRTYGHLKARFNCLQTEVALQIPELSYQTYGFQESDLNRLYTAAGKETPLHEIIATLEKIYCGSIGFEYMSIQNPGLQQWIQTALETDLRAPFTAEQKQDIFHDLNRAELFETFLHTKYVGQKRFSLEGGETLIPMLKMMVETAALEGIHEVVLGMAHRGRLNVLANLLNKSYDAIFHEFEDHYTPDLYEGTGDVKYHRGFTGALSTKQGQQVVVTLSANPSHLEAVDPVVEGQARAKQEIRGVAEVIPILIHGDASIAGQGVVYETLQLSKLVGYQTGGTVHIVVNNQIGFTAIPKDTRSTRYCTDIALAFGAPVFHVNAEDPEACVYVAVLALKIRQTFKIDVFIDLNCYRKYGHNESDEPLFTQPLQYEKIKQKKTIRKLYLEHLLAEGILDQVHIDQVEDQFRIELQKALDQVSSQGLSKAPAPTRQAPVKELTYQQRSLSVPFLQGLAKEFCQIPEGFNLHPKVRKLQEERLSMVADPQASKIDWGMGEHLAYASLLAEGVHVRLSGQDSRRGTFSHRHAVWVDQTTEKRYFPLSHLKTSQALFDVYNSSLSEFAVLGFEFGYSLSYPQALVIWEAQFGDFANGAQVVIDQFIASSEQKWGHHCGLVLFLPHGYEGQGPEHSSARLERFLQLSGDGNWTVASCTTPAQLFHLLRKQALQKPTCPLILMTPKGLLRHPACHSSLEEFAQGIFQQVLIDSTISSQNLRRVILCSGKVYYDLLAARPKADIALVRLEQLYPFPQEKIKEALQTYAGAAEWCWLQEEHQNMGAWHYVEPQFPQSLRYIGRGPSSSTAAGSYALHKKQLNQFIQEAFQ